MELNIFIASLMFAGAVIFVKLVEHYEHEEKKENKNYNFISEVEKELKNVKK